MSELKLYNPQRLSLFHPDAHQYGEPSHEGSVSDSDPVILPFDSSARRERNWGLVDRIRWIRKNTQCPTCGKAHVELLSSGDRMLSRDQMPLPGAGTLFGFRCARCSHEWQ